MKRYIRSTQVNASASIQRKRDIFRHWLGSTYINEIIDTADQGYVEPFVSGSDAVDYIIEDVLEEHLWDNRMPYEAADFIYEDEEWAKRIIGDVVNANLDRLLGRA